MSGRRCTYRMPSDVRFTFVAGEAVVLSQERAEVLVLNGVGSEVLRLLAAGLDRPEIDARLLATFDVERAELERDLEEFFATLESSGVVQPAGEVAAGGNRP